jgi:hypothetical protein
MKSLCLLLLSAFALCAADDPYALTLFRKNSASCHDSTAGAAGRVPQLPVINIKTMTPATIERTLESGIMKTQAAALSADERLKIASLLGTHRIVGRDHPPQDCAAGR